MSRPVTFDIGFDSDMVRKELDHLKRLTHEGKIDGRYIHEIVNMIYTSHTHITEQIDNENPT
jgi:hypothetical protein